ncbi:MAG: energy transducer TonB [Terracidiphilus sp.]
MFEDSTFESACRIHTRSRQWMVAAFGFNASILMAFVLIPLICPPMLPRLVNSFLMEAFVPPKPQPPQQPAQTARPATEVQTNPFQAPRTIPLIIVIPAVPDPPIIPNSSSWANSPDLNRDLFSRSASGPAVHPSVTGPLRISTSVEEGLLIQKTMPVYPAFARTTGTSGTVTLAAIISKNGTIENLRVISGPMMLQQAALDAVRTWRYRPYLLDGQPVEVETTVSVIFTLQR